MFIVSPLMRLKAFVKSTLTTAPTFSRLRLKTHTAWSAASQLKGMLDPSCFGRSGITEFRIILQIAALTTRQRILPTVTGLMPLFSFCVAPGEISNRRRLTDSYILSEK